MPITPMILLTVLLSLATAMAASCNCDAYYRAPEPQLTRPPCPQFFDNYYVRDLAQGEYLCTTLQATTGRPCTWFTASPEQITVRISEQQVAIANVLAIHVPTNAADQPTPCPGVVPPQTTVHIRTVSPFPNGFTVASHCAAPNCPWVSHTAVNSEQRRHFGDRSICNAIACGPECRCVSPNTCSCNKWWAGPHCGVFKTAACCAPPMPFDGPVNVQTMPASRVCNVPEKPWGGVCSYADSLDEGLAACQWNGVTSSVNCATCHGEYHPTADGDDWAKISSAYTGDRCDMTACARAGKPCSEPQINKCLQLCYVNATRTSDWCWLCIPQHTCVAYDPPKYACNCEASLVDLFVGDTCEYSTHNSALTAGNAETALSGVLCATAPPKSEPPVAWYTVPYGQRNPYVCAGHGVCMPLASNTPARPEWRCQCDPTYLVDYRCAVRDPCITQCNTDPLHAHCQRTGPNTALCTCTPLWYTAVGDVNNASRACNAWACEGSVRDAQGVLIAQAHPNPTADACLCPTFTAPDGRVLATLYTDDRASGRKGCRFRCPLGDGTGRECGDGQAKRCPLVWLEPNTPLEQLPWSMSCTGCALVLLDGSNWLPWLMLNESSGTCVPYCVHGDAQQSGRTGVPHDCEGKPLETCRPNCKCKDARTRLGTDVAVWTGARCDVTLCQHGATWNVEAGNCNCVQAATPPYNAQLLDDVFCTVDRCLVQHAVWNATLGECICQSPLVKTSVGNGQWTCTIECVNGQWKTRGPFQDPYCDCGKWWTGARCETSKCAPGSDWELNGKCICTKDVSEGDFCDRSLCVTDHTLVATANRCVCNSPLFGGLKCEIDRCSGAFIDIGRAERGSDGTWACNCEVKSNVYVNVNGTCGCPSEMNMHLQACSPALFKRSVIDTRCVFQESVHSGLWRCICDQGYAWNEDTQTCFPLRCTGPNAYGPGRYIEKDGYWSCACKLEWSGLECDERLVRCGNGTWNDELGVCICDDKNVQPIVDETDGDVYCPLPCANGGVYRRQTVDCQCTRRYHYGDLCQYTSEEEAAADERNQARVRIGNWQVWPLLFTFIAGLYAIAAIIVASMSMSAGSAAATEAASRIATAARRMMSLNRRGVQHTLF